MELVLSVDTSNLKKGTKSEVKTTKSTKKLSFTPTQASENDHGFDLDEPIISFDSIYGGNLNFSFKSDSVEDSSEETIRRTITLKSKSSKADFTEEYENIISQFRSRSRNNSITFSNFNKEIIDESEHQNIRKTRTSVFRLNEDDELFSKKPTKEEDIQKMTNIQEINDFNEYTEECMKIISRIKVPDESTLEGRYVTLPFWEKIGLGEGKKRLAIFDLDETLIHTELKDIESSMKTIDIKISSNLTKTVGLNIRPNFREELEKIKKNYFLIIYTASQQKYSDAVLKAIDPNNDLFSYRLYRNNCIQIKVDGNTLYIKDLRILKNVSLKDIVIIDNSVLSFAFHLNNGIPILPYYKGNEETELKNLRELLEKISTEKDLSSKLSSLINLNKYFEKIKYGEDDDSSTDEDYDFLRKVDKN